MSRWKGTRKPKKPSRGSRHVNVSITDAAAPFVSDAEAQRLAQTHVDKSKNVPEGHSAVSNFLHHGVPISVVSDRHFTQIVIALTSEVSELL